MRKRADYHYELPAELVAQAPADRRDASRLWVVGRGERRFAELAELLPAGALIVANDVRVRPARVRTTKRGSGGAVELLLFEPAELPNQWRALAKASKPLRVGAVLETASGAEVTIASERAGDGTVVVALGESIDDLCARDGELPLPGYIRRQGGVLESDAERYQTVYAASPGAVAAPTAGLHFTQSLIDELGARGFEWRTLTLEVGPGTFSPVRTELIDDHFLHRERFAIPAATASAVAAAQACGRPVVAVGTTVVRALEASARGEQGETSIFIRPGFEFRAVDHLLTNFHLPESSLLMLVCAFAGYAETMAAYRDAVERRFRFYSYGDAMLARRLP